MNLSKLERAEAIKEAMIMRDAADRLLDLLLPDDGVHECPHPADAIQDESTMDDAGSLYRCTKCGATSETPFPSISED